MLSLCIKFQRQKYSVCTRAFIKQPRKLALSQELFPFLASTSWLTYTCERAVYFFLFLSFLSRCLLRQTRQTVEGHFRKMPRSLKCFLLSRKSWCRRFVSSPLFNRSGRQTSSHFAFPVRCLSTFSCKCLQSLKCVRYDDFSSSPAVTHIMRNFIINPKRFSPYSHYSWHFCPFRTVLTNVV